MKSPGPPSPYLGPSCLQSHPVYGRRGCDGVGGPEVPQDPSGTLLRLGRIPTRGEKDCGSDRGAEGEG